MQDALRRASSTLISPTSLAAASQTGRRHTRGKPETPREAAGTNRVLLLNPSGVQPIVEAVRTLQGRGCQALAVSAKSSPRGSGFVQDVLVLSSQKANDNELHFLRHFDIRPNLSYIEYTTDSVRVQDYRVKSWFQQQIPSSTRPVRASRY